jgi:polysaccharide export outer membrane protein
MNLMRKIFVPLLAAFSMVAGLNAQQAAPPSRGASASGVAPARGTAPATAAAGPSAAAASAPADYVIGAGDVLAIVFWREPDMSAEVIVRPDGRISIPLLNEVVAIGLTPEQLRQQLAVDGQRFVQDPNVSVVVKQINSRRVFITGQVSKPGPYPLTTSMNVLQLISTAGGLLEYADEKNIVVMRNENGKTANYTFNYKEVVRRKNLKQNIDLKPGDTVIVP